MTSPDSPNARGSGQQPTCGSPAPRESTRAPGEERAADRDSQREPAAARSRLRDLARLPLDDRHHALLGGTIIVDAGETEAWDTIADELD